MTYPHSLHEDDDRAMRLTCYLILTIDRVLRCHVHILSFEVSGNFARWFYAADARAAFRLTADVVLRFIFVA